MTDIVIPRPSGTARTRVSSLGRLRWSTTALSICWLGLMAIFAVAAPWLAPADPRATNLSGIYQHPSAQHWLGTDEVGRDIASRIIWGARVSLAGPFLVVAVATVVGLIVALVAAWRGGRTDSAITAAVDVMLGFPGLLLALLAASLFGEGATAPIVALAVAYTPYFARLTRAIARKEKSQTYVAALQALGYGSIRIAARHMVPNMMALILAQAAVLFGYAMVDLAAISYLGLGVQPPTPDWGNMVASGQSGVLEGQPQVALSAGVFIVLTVIALNLVAEAIAARATAERS
jgi:peptide/nickel transport system permease protein